MITIERLKELLRYDPDTGEFTWRVRTSNRVKVGGTARSHDRCGYIRVGIDGKYYQIHRLAWLYVYGYLPEYDIDHKNGICDDNRLCNLREVSHACNMQNVAQRSDNTSGFPGVSWCRRGKEWVAKVQLHRKTIRIGAYLSAIEAATARLEWELATDDWHCNHRSVLATKIKDHLKQNPRDRKHLGNHPNAVKFLKEN